MKCILTLSLLLFILFGETFPAYAIKLQPRRISSASIKSSKNSVKAENVLKRRIAELKRQNAQLAKINAQERKYQHELFNKSRQAIFRAIPLDTSPLSNAFTGTTISVLHKGKREIFGVVASHILQDHFVSSGLLGKEFNAVFISGNVARTIPAKIVHFTPAPMGDLALVKFPAEYEPYFHPLALADIELAFPAKGYSQGYACNLLTTQTFPIVKQNSAGTLIAQLPEADLGQRAGLCGSPVFTTDFRFTGIHVGSSYKTNEGYITSVAVLKNLVKSYYNPKIRPQSIMLADQEIGRLAMDEYVSSIELLNKDQQYIWKYDTRAKFSLSKAEQELARHPETAFIRLIIGKAKWMDGHILYDEIFDSRIITTPLTKRK